LAKSLAITIVLAVILSGLGHIYLGIIKRGIVILIIGIALWVVVSWLIPFFGWIIGVAYWIWQIYDAYKLYKDQAGQTQSTAKS
jgi:TM2 domain-containing membrane protein YozV